MKRVALVSLVSLALCAAAGCGGLQKDLGMSSPTPTPSGGGGGGGNGGGGGGGTGGPSFANDVYPIFAARDCTQCHSGGGVGKNQGGLALDTGTHAVWKALTQDLSPNYGITRVDVSSPSQSLLLQKPTGEMTHPVVVLTTSDAEYQTILGWITAGAAEN